MFEHGLTVSGRVRRVHYPIGNGHRLGNRGLRHATGSLRRATANPPRADLPADDFRIQEASRPPDPEAYRGRNASSRVVRQVTVLTERDGVELMVPRLPERSPEAVVVACADRRHRKATLVTGWLEGK